MCRASGENHATHNASHEDVLCFERMARRTPGGVPGAFYCTNVINTAHTTAGTSARSLESSPPSLHSTLQRSDAAAVRQPARTRVDMRTHNTIDTRHAVRCPLRPSRCSRARHALEMSPLGKSLSPHWCVSLACITLRPPFPPRYRTNSPRHTHIDTHTHPSLSLITHNRHLRAFGIALVVIATRPSRSERAERPSPSHHPHTQTRRVYA